MVRAKNTKTVKTVKKTRVSKNLNKTKSRKVSKNSRKSRGTRQRGGNPVMISKLCASSNNGKTLGNNVSAGYLGALCSENENNKSQLGGNGSGLVSGVVSNLFKAASFPLKIASGAFNKVTGVDLTDMVSKTVNTVLNHTQEIKPKDGISDRDTDPVLREFLSKKKL